MQTVSETSIWNKPQNSQFTDEIHRLSGFCKRSISTVQVGECVLGYKAVRKTISRSPWNHCRGRIFEIEKIIRSRHGNFIPEADDAFIYLEVVTNLLFVEYPEEFVKHATSWSARWMPWASLKEVEDVIYERTVVRYKPLSADAIGIALKLSYSERQELGIRTIGACDVSKSQRAKIQKLVRRSRDRDRKEDARRQNGALPRQEYLAKAYTTTEPWKAFGISRRQWERRGKPDPKEIFVQSNDTNH